MDPPRSLGAQSHGDAARYKLEQSRHGMFDSGAALQSRGGRRRRDRRAPGHWSSKPERWPEARLLAAETREVVERANEQLPPAQRAVISLRDVEGWSSEETRNALGVSETNQRVLLHRARSKVRQALEDYLMESQ